MRFLTHSFMDAERGVASPQHKSHIYLVSLFAELVRKNDGAHTSRKLASKHVCNQVRGRRRHTHPTPDATHPTTGL